LPERLKPTGKVRIWHFRAAILLHSGSPLAAAPNGKSALQATITYGLTIRPRSCGKRFFAWQPRQPHGKRSPCGALIERVFPRPTSDLILGRIEAAPKGGAPANSPLDWRKKRDVI
jgi:hypothetical protein